MGDRILHLLFLLSGASGLIYQVVWVREFGNVFGNTIHSAALVIAVFMFGLGVGSYLGGRWADRRYAHRAGSLVVAYGAVELLIGGLGIVVSLLLPRLGDVVAALSSYTRAANGWYVLSTSSYLARYAIAVALLAPITLLMGSTLTLLVRHRVRREVDAAGWRIGVLYGVNTAGAALGALLTDYAFIPNVGLHGTQMIAALFNVLSGLGALQLAKRSVATSEAPREVAARRFTASRPWPVVLVGVAIFVSGFVAMALEIIWFRHLSAVFGSFRSVLSGILTVILVGIWLGSLLGAFLHRRYGRPFVLFMAAQVVLVVFTLAGLATVNLQTVYGERVTSVRPFVGTSAWQGEATQLWIVLKYMLIELGLPALMMGFTYPLANAMVQDTEGVVGRRAGGLYLANTAGAVLGSLATGFVLLPALGMQRSVTGLAVFTLLGLVTVYMAGHTLSPRGAPRRWPAGALAASLVVIGCSLLAWLALPPGHVVAGTIPLQRRTDRVLTVTEGVHGVIAVVDLSGMGRALMTNGHSMSNTRWHGQRYMRAFAHIPLLSMHVPRRVLVIGFGVGNTTHAASLHPTVERLDVVDTSREVLSLADYFAEANHGVLSNPKVVVHVNDGRHHLRLQPPATYDLVTLEPPPIAYAGVVSLYSREFYTLAKSRLKPGGYLTQWLPVYQVPAAVTMSMIRAFIEVFPQTVLLSGSRGELILMGVNGPRIEIDPIAVRSRLAVAPDVRTDLERVSLGTLTELIGTFVASAGALGIVVEPYPAVTDDNAVNEYGQLSPSSQLFVYGLPGRLLNVSGVADWCPKCFARGRPIQGLENLSTYVTIAWRDPTAVGRDERDRAVVASSAYLRALFPQPVSSAR
jgi:spermidine synthase